ncbi:MAG TPA: winged helix DNA-binding domain-containing protein [Propionibacteriaceae bacterium]|nr:winged helix DNA-binding domain-containing protein [Propionibacteriaceae bacterium]
MRDRDIAAWRLQTQWLNQPGDDARSAVRHLLGVQAENQRQSEWAVAARTRAPHRDAVQDLLADGTLVRTHVLRSTWHYVLPEDIGWLLDLSAARIRGTVTGILAQRGIDDGTVRLVADIVTAVLAETPDQTRQELRAAIAAVGLDLEGIVVAQILIVVELDELICSGRPRDGEHTYALFSDRVPKPRRLDREEALAEVVVRYLTGHGPATARDIAYWATLGLRDVSRGLAAAADRLGSFEHDDTIFWHASDSEPPTSTGAPRGHLLLALDEMHNGFQHSRYVIDEAGLVPRATRYPAVGMALVDGQFVAVHTRTVTPTLVRFDLVGWRPLAADEIAALTEAAERVGAYLDLPAKVTVA